MRKIMYSNCTESAKKKFKRNDETHMRNEHIETTAFTGRKFEHNCLVYGILMGHLRWS